MICRRQTGRQAAQPRVPARTVGRQQLPAQSRSCRSSGGGGGGGGCPAQAPAPLQPSHMYAARFELSGRWLDAAYRRPLRDELGRLLGRNVAGLDSRSFAHRAVGALGPGDLPHPIGQDANARRRDGGVGHVAELSPVRRWAGVFCATRPGAKAASQPSPNACMPRDRAASVNQTRSAVSFCSLVRSKEGFS